MAGIKRWAAAMLAALGMLFLLPVAAEAKWLRAESPRFIVYSDGSESALREYVRQMETFDTLLRAKHGLPETGVPPRKLPIYLVRDREDLQRTWNKAGDAVAGYYSPGGADTFAVASLDVDNTTTIRHEYAHHFMLQNFPSAYPAWMIEGYAEYYGATIIKGQFVDVGVVAQWRSDALRSGKWMPIADVLANKRAPKSNDWSDFYAESWLLTHYLMSDPVRYKQFQAYASAVAKGGDPVTTMEAVTGMTTAQLDQALRRYMNGKLAGVRLKSPEVAAPTITVTALPPSADALLLDRLQITGHYYKDADPGYLDMIRARAGRFPNDQLAVLTLGQTELELGDPAKGQALLENWIAAHPGDADAMFVLGDHWVSKAAEEKDDYDKVEACREQARRYLKRAAVIAPTDYRILFAYAQARRGEDGFPTLETQTLLVTAYKQAPQVVELRFELIQVLMARRHWREAEALLRPLVNSPHGGDMVAKARELMKRIQAALGA